MCKCEPHAQTSPCFWGVLKGALLVLLVIAAAACGGPPGVPGPLELKFGHVGAPGSLFALSAEEFARRANQALEGQAQVVAFGSSQLGGDDLLLQKIKLGTVDFALPSTILSSYVDIFGLFEMPYLVQSREHMRRIESELFWEQLAPAAEAKGYRILAVWENGYRHITNNIRAIRVPEDLAGIKLRTPRGRWRIRMFQAYGANPTPMPFSEVFVALQTGVMDGQENPFAQTVTSKLHEVQEFLSLTGHVYTPAYVTVSPRRWDALPQEVRTRLETIAREVQEYVYQSAQRLEEELLEQLRRSGIQINEIDRTRFIAASQRVYQEFAQAVPEGEDLLAQVAALKANLGSDSVQRGR